MEDRITFNPKILAGKPLIKGTRISVEYLLELLASGMQIEEILLELPHIDKEDVLAAINYAANALKHEELILVR
jgi:uncharacterized protein (DUF433 family)